MPEALLSAQAQAVPKDRPQEAAEVSVRAAAEPRRAAVPGAWEPGVPRAVQEAAHAVAEPQPGAAKAASGPQAAVGAVAVPDGPQVAAEAAAELLAAAGGQPGGGARGGGAGGARGGGRAGGGGAPAGRAAG